jgi:WhiB family redox-sensing transcriptional regulator
MTLGHEHPRPEAAGGWEDRAACLGMPTTLFFPETGQSAQARRAKTICDSCPVRVDCLEAAIATDSHHDHGIRGGLSETARNALRLQRARAAA